MFWQQPESSASDSLTAILNAENIILQAVLDDEFTLQEIRNSNKALLKYLTTEEVLVEIVGIALCSPESDVNLKQRYKNSHMCTEILTVNNAELAAAVIGSEKVMNVILHSLDVALNPVVASFFMRIITHLFGRSTAQLLEKLDSSFVTKCVNQIESSSFADAIIRMATAYTDSEFNAGKFKLFLEGGLREKLCAVFTPSHSFLAHHNASYLYCELIRNTREVLYSNDDKENALHESLQSEEGCNALLDAMFTKDESGNLNESISINTAIILKTLLETNFIPNRPSHQLDENRMEMWTGSVPDNPNTLGGVTVWQPDAARLVETTVTQRAPELISAILAELQLKERDETWLMLLHLLVELCDTNSHETQAALYAAFKNNNMKKLLTLASDRPELTLLHNQLRRMVQYILHSAVSPETPLLVYLFNDVDIISVVLGGIRQEAAEVPLNALRAFFMQLASDLHVASETGPNSKHLAGILKASTKWPEVFAEVQPYEEKNKAYDVDGGGIGTSARRPPVCSEETLSEPCQLAHASLHEYEQHSACQALPSHFDPPLSALTQPLEAKHYFVDTSLNVDMASPLHATGVSEADFEQLCALRSTLVLDADESWPNSSGLDWSREQGAPKGDVSKRVDTVREGGKDEWPETASLSTAALEDNTFPVEWDVKKIKCESAEDDWPTSPKFAESDISRPVGNWADFGALKEEEWGSSQPVPVDKEESGVSSGDWPVSVDPVMAGIASGLISASFERNSSDC